MSENGGREQPRSGERMQPTAQAVGGAPTESQPWRGGRQMSHTCGNILLHLNLQHSRTPPLIETGFRSELFAYLGGIVREMRGTALIINCTADHVHMLVRTRPAQAPAELAGVVKTNSSRWVREKWSPNFEWQTGYGVFSVSESNVAAVTKYIASQEEHHKKHSFQDEFLAFLKKNGIARTRNIFGTSFFRPSGTCVVSVLYPRLAPWAAFFRRLAALQFHANLDAHQTCDLLPGNKRAAFARRARVPLSAKEKAHRSG